MNTVDNNALEPAIEVIDPKLKKNTFLSSWAGLILLAVALILAIVAFVCNPYFSKLDAELFETLGKQVMIFMLLGLSALLTTRSRGADISLPAIMSFGAMIFVINPNPFGLIFAVVVCALIGALNGLLLIKCKLNSIITTLATSLLLKGLLPVIVGSDPLYLPQEGFEISIAIMIVVTVLIIAATVLFLCFTNLGAPLYLRKKDEQGDPSVKIVSYAFGGFIAGFAGIFIANMIGGYVYNIEYVFTIAFPLEYEYVILLCAFVTLSSKFLDNKKLTVPATLAATLVYTIGANALPFYSVPGYVTQLIVGALLLLFILLAKYVKRQQRDEAHCCCGCAADEGELVAGFDPDAVAEEVPTNGEVIEETKEETKTEE